MKKTNAVPEAVPDVYPDLLNSIKQEIAKTQDEIQRQKAVCYWKIGEHIAKYLLNNKGKAGYNEQLHARLSLDLKINERTLQQTVEVYRSFPIPNTCSELNWSNYRELLAISDQDSRDAFFEKVKGTRITARELRSQIKDLKRKGEPDVSLDINKGTLYTYRTDTQAFSKPTKGRTLVDLGFGILREIPFRGIGGLALGSVVESQIEKGGFVLVKSDRTTDHLYTYQAYSRLRHRWRYSCYVC